MEEQKLESKNSFFINKFVWLNLLFFINFVHISDCNQKISDEKYILNIEVNVESYKDSIFIKIINKSKKEFKFNTYLQSYGLHKPDCWYTSENDIYFEIQAKVKKMTKLNPMDSLTESVVKISEFYYSIDSTSICDSSIILNDFDKAIHRLALIGKLGDNNVIVYSNLFKY